MLLQNKLHINNFIRIYAGARSSVSLGSFLPMVGSSSSGIPSPASKGILQFVFPILIDFRWFAIICLVTGFLITELNTFYLKWGLCWAIFWSFWWLMDISGQQCKIFSWRSSRFVMWVPPNHLLNPIRLLFILLWGAVSIYLFGRRKTNSHFIRLPFARHLNCWTTLNVTNWAVKAGWWSPSLSPSC